MNARARQPLPCCGATSENALHSGGFRNRAQRTMPRRFDDRIKTRRISQGERHAYSHGRLARLRFDRRRACRADRHAGPQRRLGKRRGLRRERRPYRPRRRQERSAERTELRHPRRSRRQRRLPQDRRCQRRYVLLVRAEPARQRGTAAARDRNGGSLLRAEAGAGRTAGQRWKGPAASAHERLGDVAARGGRRAHLSGRRQLHRAGRRALLRHGPEPGESGPARPARPHDRLQALVRRARGRVGVRAVHGQLERLRDHLGQPLRHALRRRRQRPHRVPVGRRRTRVVLRHHRRYAGTNLFRLRARHRQDADSAEVRLRPDSIEGALCQSEGSARRRRRLSQQRLSARCHGGGLVLLDAHGPDGHQPGRVPRSRRDEQTPARHRHAIDRVDLAAL